MRLRHDLKTRLPRYGNFYKSLMELFRFIIKLIPCDHTAVGADDFAGALTPEEDRLLTELLAEMNDPAVR